MKTLESLLDDRDIFSGVSKEVTSEMFKKYVKGTYKIVPLKTGALKVWGDILIYGLDEAPNLRIASLEGNCVIDACNFDTLEGIFEPGCKITKDLSISRCPNLTSLAGCPERVEDFTATDCKSLRSLEGAPLAYAVSIMKCGKRFKESAVKHAFRVCIKIFCSEEAPEANITEALSDPILIRFWEQMCNNKFTRFKLTNLCGTDIRYNEISPGACEKYTFNDKKLPTALRKVLANTNADTGFVLAENFNGRFVWWITFNHDWWSIYNETGKGTLGVCRDDNLSITDIINRTKPTSAYMQDIKYVYIYNLTKYSGLTGVKHGAWELTNKRAQDRQGMIEYTKEGFKRYRQENINRYKAAIKQIRASKNVDQYKQYMEAAEKIMTRFQKVMTKMIHDMKWANENKYVLDSLFMNISGSSGVVSQFDAFSNTVNRNMYNPSTYTTPPNPQGLTKACLAADGLLKRLGY